MNSIYIRITLPEMEDEEYLKLKKALSVLLEDVEGAQLEITIVSLPPAPPREE